MNAYLGTSRHESASPRQARTRPAAEDVSRTSGTAQGSPKFLQRKCAVCGNAAVQVPPPRAADSPRSGLPTFLQSVDGARTATASHSESGIRIGDPGDHHEREADAVAAQIMRADRGGGRPQVSRATRQLHRKCATCDAHDDDQLQRKSDGAGSVGAAGVAPAAVGATLQRGGHALDARTRSFFEPRFGRDLGAVRVHVDRVAQQSAREVNALAYTVGHHIVFGAGQYAPDNQAGRHLLAHELVHVMQQRGEWLSRATAAPAQASTGTGEGTAPDGAAGDACSTGRCEDCAGGMRDLWITVFFRRRATRRTMDVLNAERNQAKEILRNCCITLKMDFDWRLLRGPSVMPAGSARPAGDADGAWDYTDDSEQLGEGTTFAGARGIPMVVADEVPGTGGGVTVSRDFDRQYSGRSYMIWGRTGSNTASNTIAHELWHVAGGLTHDPAAGSVVEGTGHEVSSEFCTRLRALT